MLKAVNPTFRVDLQLLSGSDVVAEFDAAFWEPVDANSPGALTLACTSPVAASNAMYASPCSLEGKIGSKRFSARNVWVKGLERELHPNRRHARPILMLDQIYELEVAEETKSRASAELEYFLTPCGLCDPTVIVHRYPDGQIERDVIALVSFDHVTLGPITFDTLYRVVETAPGIRSETSSLCAKLNLPSAQPLAVVEIDDAMREVLMVAGFAARYPIRIWGRQHASETEFIRTYFQALTSWVPDWPAGNQDDLIPKQSLPKFLAAACVELSKLTGKQRDATQHALLAARSAHGTTEDQFRAVFSSFEGLCTVFDSKGGQRLNADERARKRRVKKALTEALQPLKEEDPALEIDAILSRLERTGAPPEQRFKRFVENFDVPIDDLWPAYESGPNVMSLYAIRNRLAHGSLFSPTDLNAIHAALRNLQLLLERCVLRILGWDVLKSTACPACVAYFVSCAEVQRLKSELARNYIR